jgi:hypothetical protein
MAQVINIISSATVGAATAKLLNISSGAVVATAASATLTGGLWYACSFSGVTEGTYAFCLYDGGTERSGMLVSIDAANGTWGDLTDATSTSLEAIQAKTDLITSKTVGTQLPVASSGVIDEIIIGDDYLAANGREFEWTIAAPTGFVLATSTCSFGGKKGTETWLVSGTITDAGAGNWTLSFDLNKTDTEGLEPGTYEWSVEVKNVTNKEITKVRSRTTKVKLVEKQT